jgi:AcrR family transcriptional regulator
VRRRHDRGQLLTAAVDAALEGGLAGLTFGAVARRAGVPDRTVVYYFPTKADLVGAVIAVTAQTLMERLEAAVGAERRSPAELLAALWPALKDPATRPVVHVWLETCVRAGADEQPYRDAAQELARGWLGWLGERVEAPTDVERRAAAVVLLARIDGALLLRHIGLNASAEASVRS